MNMQMFQRSLIIGGMGAREAHTLARDVFAVQVQQAFYRCIKTDYTKDAEFTLDMTRRVSTPDDTKSPLYNYRVSHDSKTLGSSLTRTVQLESIRTGDAWRLTLFPTADTENIQQPGATVYEMSAFFSPDNFGKVLYDYLLFNEKIKTNSSGEKK